MACCSKRKLIVSGEERRSSLDKIKNKCISLGFEFLSNSYKNRKQIYEFRCLTDNQIHKSVFANILSGHGLSCCKSRKISSGQCGENNSQWNPRLSEKDRLKRKRHGWLNDGWAKKVKNRDLGKCKICNSSNRLNAHHLESYSNNMELRYVVDNGITLCRHHHVLFHRLYGKTANTRSQFLKFQQTQRRNVT